MTAAFSSSGMGFVSIDHTPSNLLNLRYDYAKLCELNGKITYSKAYEQSLSMTPNELEKAIQLMQK